MKKEKHPNGSTIVFKEYPHSYFLEDKPNETFTSVTQICKKYINKFDVDTISKAYAKKHDMNRKHVVADWANRGKVATDLGNSCHAYAESLVTGIPIKLDTKYNNYYKQIKQKFKKDLLGCDEIKAEYIIGIPNIKIAGTIDLIKRIGNEVTIIDWKTNKEIASTNRFKKMLQPFQLLDDCNLNTYRLQINLYRYILKSEGYFPDCTFTMWIYHIKEDRIINIPILEIADNIIESIFYKKPETAKTEHARNYLGKRYPKLFEEEK